MVYICALCSCHLTLQLTDIVEGLCLELRSILALQLRLHQLGHCAVIAVELLIEVLACERLKRARGQRLRLRLELNMRLLRYLTSHGSLESRGAIFHSR